MKSRLGREILLLCAPIAILGAVFVWNTWQKRFRTPRIALSMRFDPTELPQKRKMPFSPDEKLRFAWSASLKGGPKSNYRFGWNEQIIATQFSGKRTIVWNWSASRPDWRLRSGWETNTIAATIGFGGAEMQISTGQGLNQRAHHRRYEFDAKTLPLDTRQLEWRGEIVAIPSDDAQIWQSPMSSKQLEAWRAVPGAASWKGSRLLARDAAIFDPVLIRSQKSTEPSPDSKSQIDVEILSKRVNRRASRRLVTFDGKTRRVLWTDKDRINIYCRSYGISSYPQLRNTRILGFDVGAIPTAWGEVALECETVFDLHKRAPVVPDFDANLSEKELLKWEKQFQGWRVSQRYVLRPMAKENRSKAK